MNKLDDYLESIDGEIFQDFRAPTGERLVLLSWSKKSNRRVNHSPKFLNLLRVDDDGNIIWTVTPPHPLEGCYGGLRYENGEILATNLTGNVEKIYLESGKTEYRYFVK